MGAARILPFLSSRFERQPRPAQEIILGARWRLDTVSLVKGFPRLAAREAVLDAIFDRVSAGLFQDVVSHLKRFRRPDRRRGPI